MCIIHGYYTLLNNFTQYKRYPDSNNIASDASGDGMSEMFYRCGAEIDGDGVNEGLAAAGHDGGAAAQETVRAAVLR